MGANLQQFFNRNLGALLALLFCAPLLPGCAFYGGGVSGYVYEWVDQSKPPTKDNLKPVPDAYVVATWSGTVPTPIAHATSTCLNVKLGKTDAAGRYEISGWFRFPHLYPVFMNEAGVSEYKPGYEHKDWVVNGLGTAQFNLVPSTQTPDQRLEFIDDIIDFYCREMGNDLYRELLPMYKTALQEVQSVRGASPNLRLRTIQGIQEFISRGESGQVSK